MGALKADGGSSRDLAQRAGISFRAIAEAREGFSAQSLQSTRKQLGVVSSMTRLAIALEISPSDVLSELGIDVSDAAVQRQVERARNALLLRSYKEDPVMRAVRARELSQPSLGPVVGIVPWSPFTDDLGRGSFARLLARSVLGSLNSAWDRESNIRIEKDFRQAERRLLSNDPDSPHWVLGLYDLPGRRRAEIDVVQLPGLYVRVGALCTRPALRWIDILAGTPDTPLPHAVVIEGDIGDRLLTGPIDYPEARIVTRLRLVDPVEIAARIQHYLQSEVYPDGFLFVADGPLIRAVQSELGPSSLQIVDGDAERRWAPAMRFGFAVRHDAERFHELLSDAISADLMGRALPRTVYLYLELLKADRTKQIGIDLLELETRQRGLARRFVEIAETLEPGNLAFLRAAVRDEDEVAQWFTPPAIAVAKP
ncbi:MAG: hypothetical protein ABL986_22360 [Vicinamibacterales bacterium]